MTLNTLLSILGLLTLLAFSYFLWLLRQNKGKSELVNVLFSMFAASSFWILFRIAYTDFFFNETWSLFFMKLTFVSIVPSSWLALVFTGLYTQKSYVKQLKLLSWLMFFLHAAIQFGSNLIIKRAIYDPSGGYAPDPGSGFFVFGLIIALPLAASFLLSLRYLFSREGDRVQKLLFLLAISSPLLVGVSTGIIGPALGLNTTRYSFFSVIIMMFFFVLLIQRYAAFNISFNDLPIATRTLVSISLASFLPFLIFLYLSFQFVSMELISAEQSKVLELEIERAHAIELMLGQYQKNVQALTELDAIKTLGNTENADESTRLIQNIFVEILKSDPVYLQLRFIDITGKEKVRTNNESGFMRVVDDSELQDKSDRYYVQEAMALGRREYITTDIDLNKEQGQVEVPHVPTLRVAAPVYNENELVGIVVANLSADELIRLSIDHFEPTVFFVDAEGYYSYHYDEELAWSNPKNGGAGQKVTEALPDGFESLYAESQTIQLDQVTFWLTTPIKLQQQGNSTTIVLVKEFSLVEELAGLSSIQTRFFSWSGVVFLIMLGSSYLLSRSISNPIDELLRSTELIQKGNFKHRAKVHSKDELGKLAQAFNMMTASIESSRKEIEQRVKQQTEEIQRKNSILEEQQAAVMNILDDIEAEKERATTLAAELNKFQLAVEFASDQVVITDPDGVILYANPATEHITGYLREDIIGKKAGGPDLWGGLEAQDVYTEFWDTIKNKKQKYEGKFRNRRKDGQEYIAQASVSPVVNNQGDLLFFVGIERDVTKAHEVDRMKTEFISLASHQLRTPLTAIKWYIEMLQEDDGLSQDTREVVAIIDKSSDRMVALVNSLLNISRIESGRIIVEPEQTDLVEVMHSVVLGLENKIIEKHHQVNEDYQDVPHISVDPRLIREVYANLVTNAIKYTPEHGKIAVRVYEEGDSIITQVSDNGLGIPAAGQQRVFQKFYRGDNVVKTSTDGTGLGLYLVKLIVEVSGGKIWFESTENAGSSFWVSLPKSGSPAKVGEVKLS